MNKPQTKIGIAISGGIDSTVSALLLKQQGHNLHGFFMNLPLENSAKQVSQAKAVADSIDIPLEIIDLSDQFNNLIVDYFVKEYLQGSTPNPCIICNHTIKFGLLQKVMFARGMDYMATGHYARIENDKTGGKYLAKGLDPGKDQSYFLCRLTATQLERVIFPLGSWRKDEVRAMAKDSGLINFSQPESQDVCFLKNSLQSFLYSKGVREQEGDICTVNGKILGRHHGIFNYTIGQRRGLGLPDATPWYVVGLDSRRNRVVVGKSQELFHSSITVIDLLWSAKRVTTFPWRGLVQFRSSQKPVKATLKPDSDGDGKWIINCDSPQRAITPGQFAVFYKNNRLMASAVISAPQ
jgi:tRNA-specific 2-thiouridylase